MPGVLERVAARGCKALAGFDLDPHVRHSKVIWVGRVLLERPSSQRGEPEVQILLGVYHGSLFELYITVPPVSPQANKVLLRPPNPPYVHLVVVPTLRQRERVRARRKPNRLTSSAASFARRGHRQSSVLPDDSARTERRRRGRRKRKCVVSHIFVVADDGLQTIVACTEGMGKTSSETRVQTPTPMLRNEANQKFLERNGRLPGSGHKGDGRRQMRSGDAQARYLAHGGEQGCRHGLGQSSHLAHRWQRGLQVAPREPSLSACGWPPPCEQPPG